MPDTRPITDSFPWFAIRYRPVFDGPLTPVLASDDRQFVLTDDSGVNVLIPDNAYLIRLYRYI